MIYAINNGCEHEDEAIYFIETDLMPSEIAALIEIEHGPAEQQVHRWTKIPEAKGWEKTGWEAGGRKRVGTAYAHEIPYLLFIADVSTWAPNLEDGGHHEGISAQRLTKTPRGEIYWLARESTGRLEQLAKLERARADEDRAAKAAGHPRAMGTSHPKWKAYEPIRAELEWRQLGKTCGCGRHHTARAWLELEEARFQYSPEDDEDGPELLECRHCKCGSTIARLHQLHFAWRPARQKSHDTGRRLEEIGQTFSGAYAVARNLPDAPNCYVLHLSARPFAEGQDLFDVEPVGDAVLTEVVRRLRDAVWTNTLAGLRVLNGRADVVLWWPAAVRFVHPGSTSWISAAQEALADHVVAAAAAQRELEQHRQRVEQLAGAGFTRAAIDTAMAAIGVRVARLEEGTVEGMTPRAGDRHVLIVLAPARVPRDSPLNHVEWRNAVRWFRANAPIGVVVEVHNVGRHWSNASAPLPLPPPRSPV